VTKKPEGKREYCPICKPGYPAVMPGFEWVVVHHPECLKQVLEREQKVLAIMEIEASHIEDKATLDAMMKITAAIAGNSR